MDGVRSMVTLVSSMPWASHAANTLIGRSAVAALSRRREPIDLVHGHWNGAGSPVIYDGSMVDEIFEPVGLEEPFRRAARDALGFIAAYRDPVLGIVLGGSKSCGDGDANSDLDFYVVTTGDHRQRVQRRFNDVPCEMFFNPARQIRKYFAEEAERGKTSAVGLLLDSQVLLDVNGVVAELREEARTVRMTGPQVPTAVVQQRTYLAIDTLDNARDLVDRDPALARLLASSAVQEALAMAYVLAGNWIPRDKDLIEGLEIVCPQAVEAIRGFGDDPSPDRAGAVLNAVFGHDTFFEWESTPEAV
jgi:hypothetical protein